MINHHFPSSTHRHTPTQLLKRKRISSCRAIIYIFVVIEPFFLHLLSISANVFCIPMRGTFRFHASPFLFIVCIMLEYILIPEKGQKRIILVLITFPRWNRVSAINRTSSATATNATKWQKGSEWMSSQLTLLFVCPVWNSDYYTTLHASTSEDEETHHSIR